MKNINCKNYDININNWSALHSYLESKTASQTFIIVDANTEKYCLHQFLENTSINDVHIIRIPAGETYKTIETCQKVWAEMMRKGADRHALVINLGGGVIGDLGGFCAATYMRGISFIQVPTTLLSQVDASVGGKLGVDFSGFKNMIGIIQEPEGVFIFTDFLETLPEEQMRSGYAELLKHGLIADKLTWKSLTENTNLKNLDFENIVYQSVLIKKQVTEQDPNEKGLRKILNFGHTIGHAIESYWLDSRSPLLHGEAIAIGMVSEAFLSYRLGKISENELFDIRHAIVKMYGHHPKYVKPSVEILSIMKADKKNKKGEYRFALLESVGKACFDIPVSSEHVEESLLFYKEKL